MAGRGAFTKGAFGAETRERLIAASLTVMRAKGTAGFTLDAVAAEAAVSKGALLHHFPSKDALIEAVLRRLFMDFEGSVRRYFEEEPALPGRWLRAYVRASFDDGPLPLEVGAVLFTSLSQSPALLALVREDFARWQTRLLNDGVPPARAMVVRQAADAAWSERMLQDTATDRESRQAVLDELLRLTQPEER